MNRESENNASENSREFGLPQDYFQNSAKAILHKIEWQEEHALFPNLVSQKNNSAFEIPQNYFNRKAIALELLDVPNLASKTKENSFLLPDGYFEELEQTRLNTLLNENSKDALGSERLRDIPKTQGFSVQENYFEDNSARLHTLLQEPATSRIIQLFSRRISLSAAALLVIALGIWLYAMFSKTAAQEDCGTIACIEKKDLLKFKNLDNLETEDLYELVNSKELEKKLEKKNSEPKPVQAKDSSLQSVSTDDLLDEI